MKWSCWGHWGHWGCWNHWGHWDCRGFKAWKITTEDFRVIQAKEVRCPCPGIWIQHYFYVLRKNFFGWNHEISYWILAPFLSEAVEASQYYFFENWFIKLKCLTFYKGWNQTPNQMNRTIEVLGINQTRENAHLKKDKAKDKVGVGDKPTPPSFNNLIKFDLIWSRLIMFDHVWSSLIKFDLIKTK